MSDSTEIATQDPASREIAATSVLGNVGALLDAMMKLAKDPTVDAAKFETIARVANEQQDRAQRQQYYEDKASAMFEMPSIRKDSKIIIPGKNGDPARVQGTFAKWPDMQRAIYPILDRYNLRLSHDVDHEGTIVLVTPILQHRNGFVERGGQMALPLDTSGGKNNTQGAGSAQSYGMRYTTVAMLGIRYEAADDDGNLIALPDEPLNDQQQRRVKEAEAAAAQGREAYENWFQSIPAIDRAWMIQTGRHAEFGGGAPLPGANAQPRQADAPAAPAGDQAGPAAPARKAPRTTPAEWTARYEADCAAAADLGALAELQTAAAKSLGSLKDRDPALHQRCVEAGAKAFARLSGGADEGAADDTAEDLFGGDGK